MSNLPQALETMIKQTWGSDRALEEWAASQPPASTNIAHADKSKSVSVAEESGHKVTETASQQSSGISGGGREQQAASADGSYAMHAGRQVKQREDTGSAREERTQQEQDQRKNKRKRQDDVEVTRSMRSHNAAPVVKPSASSQPARVSLLKFKNAVTKSKRLSKVTAATAREREGSNRMPQSISSNRKKHMEALDDMADQPAASHQNTRKSSGKDASHKSASPAASRHGGTDTRKVAAIQQTADTIVIKDESETVPKKTKSQQRDTQKVPTAKETPKDKRASKEEEAGSSQKKKKDADNKKKPTLGLLGVQGPYGVGSI